ncbi:MAG: ketopantoate reductase family protein [Bacillota bacterium]
MRTGWPRSIGVLGAGALGTLFAHGLASRTLAAGTRVMLLARSPGPDSITIEGRTPVAVERVTNPQEPVDLLIVLVKAYATAGAMRWAAGAVGPQTIVLTLQNGLGNAEVLAAAVGPERVLVGTTAQGATLLEPGLVRNGGHGPTLIAPWLSQGPAAELAPHVSRLLSRAGFPSGVTPDAGVLLWSKLVVNAAINPLTALYGIPNGMLLERQELRRLMEAAAREAGGVAAALGIGLKEDPAERAVAVARATAVNRSSMLQDLERGRRTEIEAINGALVERALAIGLSVPVNETLTLLVREAERRRA